MLSLNSTVFEIKRQLQVYRIPESAVQDRIRKAQETQAGLNQEQWWKTAAIYLIEGTQEFRRYGATVDWS